MDQLLGAAADKVGFDPSTMTASHIYKILTGAIVPRPIGFLSTVSLQGAFNAAPFSFFNGISDEPPLVCASIATLAADNDTPKDTLANILDTGEFVANIVTEDIAAAQDYCGIPFAAGVDELAMSGLTPAPSRLVKPPRIEESPVNFECRLEQSVALAGSRYTLVIGRVVYMHVRNDVLIEGGRIDPHRLRAIGRMAGTTYVRTADTLTFDRKAFVTSPGSPARR